MIKLRLEGKQLAEQWLYIARKQLRKEIGSELINKKLALLRKEAREKGAFSFEMWSLNINLVSF